MKEIEKIHQDWKISNEGKENIFQHWRILSEIERQQLSRMLHFALIEIRILGNEGKAQQCGDLADAFHELPSMMWGDFSLSFFRLLLEGYQKKHSEIKIVDYLGMLNEIFKNGK